MKNFQLPFDQASGHNMEKTDCSYSPSSTIQDEFSDIAVWDISVCKLNWHFISKSPFPKHLHSVTPSGETARKERKFLADKDARLKTMKWWITTCHVLHVISSVNRFGSNQVLSHDIFDNVITCAGTSNMKNIIEIRYSQSTFPLVLPYEICWLAPC